MKNRMSVSLQLIALTVAASVAALSTTGRAEEHANIDPSKLPPAATKQGVTYASAIKAIFDKSCVKCHGQEKPKAKLRLDSLEGALKGGADGKVIEPGNSVKSTLFLNVTRLGEEDSWMPPKDNKAKIAPLTSVEMGLIRAWIDQGAK